MPMQPVHKWSCQQLCQTSKLTRSAFKINASYMSSTIVVFALTPVEGLHPNMNMKFDFFSLSCNEEPRFMALLISSVSSAFMRLSRSYFSESIAALSLASFSSFCFDFSRISSNSALIFSTSFSTAYSFLTFALSFISATFYFEIPPE